MTTGRITFRKGGHPSARAQIVQTRGLIASALDDVFAELATARRRKRLPALRDPERHEINSALRKIALIHQGMRDAFEEAPKAQDVRETLLALARSADKEAFCAALRDCDAATQDRIALAAWKTYKRDGMRTPRDVFEAIGIEQLREIALATARSLKVKGGRPPDEHHSIAIRTLARLWWTFTRTKASPGSKQSDGPFRRFIEAARNATGASFPPNREAVERALRS